MNHNPDLNATKHFLADKPDLPNLAERVVNEVDGQVVIEYVKPKEITTDDLTEDGDYKDGAPHDVLATSWDHPNVNGVLTKELFFEHLDAAITDMADRLVANGQWRAYPMRNKPPTTYGRAYHDFHKTTAVAKLAPEDQPTRGHGMPTKLPIGEAGGVDVRLIIEYGQILHEDDVLSGLKFHLVTLLEKGSYAGSKLGSEGRAVGGSEGRAGGKVKD